jgi:hypothetical protein
MQHDLRRIEVLVGDRWLTTANGHARQAISSGPLANIAYPEVRERLGSDRCGC